MADYALITDFDSTRDRLQVHGPLDYQFQVLDPDNERDLPAGIGVFADGELIAILQDLEALEAEESAFMIRV